MATFGHRKHSRDFAIAISAGRLPMGSRERIIAVATTPPLWVLLLIAAPTLVAAQGDMARMKSDYRRPPPSTIDSQVLVDLGRDLFFDPLISASGKTACASCHFPELGWTVTDTRSQNDPVS
jgi:cytochrome c peroxidase